MIMRYNILFGGKAGQGPNILTHVLGEALVKQGFYVFYSRDYQSLIRGGHNFNVLTFSDKPVKSNDSEIDVLVCLDENSEKIHKNSLGKKGIILKGNDSNMYYAGKLFKILGLDFSLLENELRNLKKRFEENLKEAEKGYLDVEKSIELVKVSPKKSNFMNGNQGIAEGAIKSGIDIYYAYPMTPATPVLGELASKQIEKNYIVLELENEIAVANAGVGSAITGAKTMVGTSGGGFDLMGETLSLTGIAGVPLVFYLSQRPGPGTGVATYTAQGDLNIARHSGHGEFNRIVLAPGDPKESEELTNQAFYFSQKFRVPSIIVSDKHLGESFYTVEGESKMISVPKENEIGRYNSYEIDKEGSATEDPKIINKNIEERIKVGEHIKKESAKFEGHKIFGDKKSNNVVISWGSTKGAILDSIEGLNCKFIQVLYIEPFPEEIRKEILGKNVILVENSSTGQLGSLIREKTGIEVQHKILRYDGRPFLCNELKEEIKKRLRK